MVPDLGLSDLPLDPVPLELGDSELDFEAPAGFSEVPEDAAAGFSEVPEEAPP